MRHIRTKKGTAPFHKPSRILALVERLLGTSNPDYDFDAVQEWMVEFDENDHPWREIGLDESGVALFSGPDERNYGFWLDTNLVLSDFEDDSVAIAPSVFEKHWREARSRIE
jgi:hypothetical protein